MNLSESVTRKFIETYPVKNKEVLTNNGYKPIKSVSKTVVYQVYEVKLENGMSIKCADDHILITNQMTQVFAKDSLGHVLKTVNGDSKVISVENLKKEEHMYDIEVDSDDHLYYADGILSHNSLLASIFITYTVIFGKDLQVGVAANKQIMALEILDKIKTAYRYIPAWMQPGVEVWNTGSIKLSNGCRIRTAATSESSFRGMTFASDFKLERSEGVDDIILSSILYVDEIAFIDKTKWEGFKKSVLPTTSSGKHARIIYTSTPQGMNHFHKLWMDAKTGISGFNAIEYPYWIHPDRKDPKWKEEKIAELGGDLVAWNQEYLCSFVGSSRTLIDGEVLSKFSAKDPLRTVGDIAELKIYEEPIEGHFYVCGVDTSKYSNEGDFSSFHILDITKKPFKQVASFRGRDLTYLDMVDPVFEACTMYNDALLFVENNSGDGQSMVDLLFQKHEYDNIYIEKQPVFGFRTTTSTRKIGLQNLRKLASSDMLEIVDKNTLEELQFFALHNGKYQAIDGYSDDAVMALVACLFFLQDPNYVDSEELYDSVFNKMKNSESDEDEVFAFGFVSDGGGYSFF